MRSSKWMASVVGALETPVYERGAVDTEGDEAEGDDGSGEKRPAEEDEAETPAMLAAKLEAQLARLAALAAPTAGTTFVAADFEKDDDYNFHIQVRRNRRTASRIRIPQLGPATSHHRDGGGSSPFRATMSRSSSRRARTRERRTTRSRRRTSTRPSSSRGASSRRSR